MALLNKVKRLFANWQENELSNNPQSNLQSFDIRCSADKLLLNTNDKVLVNQTVGIIQQIQYCNGVPKNADFKDIITVKFNGQIQHYNRYQLTLHPNYVQNIKRLTKYCKQQWRDQYINGVAVCNDTKYNIWWSDQIHCRAPLLHLIPTSVIYIFAIDINSWCFGKIMDIKKSENDMSALDILKVHYVKCGKKYVKYIHQFSNSIALVDDKICTETDCSVFNEINETTPSQKDATDLKYCRLLLHGYYRDICSICISNDILNLLVQHIDYSYGLVMAIEQETFLITIAQRDNKLMPNCLPKNGLASLPPLHPIEIKVRDKLMDKNAYTTERFRNAIKMLRLGLRENEGMYNKLSETL